MCVFQNFWNIVAKFTHGEVIAQLKHLGQITTEVGLCRVGTMVVSLQNV